MAKKIDKDFRGDAVVLRREKKNYVFEQPMACIFVIWKCESPGPMPNIHAIENIGLL